MAYNYSRGILWVCFFLSVILLLGAGSWSDSCAQDVLISENMQDWDAEPYGNHAQEIRITGNAGTVIMTDVLVNPAGSASGAGSAGFALMGSGQPSLLELPEVSSVSQVEFTIGAFGEGRTLRLEHFDGTHWIEAVTFTGIGMDAQSYTHDVEMGESVRFRLATQGHPVRVHDIFVRCNSAAETPQSFTIPLRLFDFSYLDNARPPESRSIESADTGIELADTGIDSVDTDIELADTDIDSVDTDIESADIDSSDIDLDDPADPAATELPISTSFGNADYWDLNTGVAIYDEKAYSEGGWHFHSTEAVRGTAGESFGGSAHSFRDRGDFTLMNMAAVSDMSGFTIQLRDGMENDGATRRINVSFDGGDNWENVGTIDKDWFHTFQVYQQFSHDFAEAMDFDAEQLIIEVVGGDGTNDSRINIGQFQALKVSKKPALSVSQTTLSGFTYHLDDGPSEARAFLVTGENFDGTEVVIVAPAGLKVSVNEDGPFSSEITLTEFGGEEETVWVQLAEDLDVGTYTGNITVSGSGADSVTVSLSGEVREPVLSGDMLVRYPFYENGHLEAFTVEKVSASDFSISGGSISGGSIGYGAAQSTEWTGPMPYAEGSGGWGQENPESARYFSFTITAEEGQIVTVDRIEFDERATGDGPVASTIFANGVIVETGEIPENVTRSRTIHVNKSFDEVEFRFAGWNNGSRESGGSGSYRVNDFTVYGTVTEGVLADLAGNAGWRMLSLPVEGMRVAELAAQNQVQGISGIEAFYGASAPEGIESKASNIYTFNETEWSAPDNVSDVLEIGKGLIWYLFNNDAGVSTPLPFTLAATGASPAGDVSTSLHTTSSETVDDGEGGMVSVAFNLLGNPFAADLDISEIADWVDGGALNSSIVQVWKIDEAGWQEGIGHQGEWVLIGGGNNDNKVAAWQGFMVENNDATEIVYPADARTDGATFHKEQELKRLVFRLEGENEQRGLQTRDAASLLFDENAEGGWDLLDATQLTPLAGSFATLSFVGERNGLEVLKVQESRPAGFEGVFELPVAFQTYNMGGDFTISWEGLADLPADWQLTLVDTETGARVNLRDVDAYRFSYESDSESSREKAVGTEAEMPLITPLQLRVDEDGDDGEGVGAGARFRLVVNSEPVSSGIQEEVPMVFDLSQNYPNPFNPTTMISYTVPEQLHVRLTVYDMLGREIAVLVNEQKGPGSYNVHWNATEFSSGMYLYRIEAGNKSITRRMTFIK